MDDEKNVELYAPDARLTRRLLLKALAAAGVELAVLGPLGGLASRATAQGRTLRLLSWGWGYAETVERHLVPRLQTRYPQVNVALEIGTNAANYAKLLAQQSRPVISGGTFNSLFSYRGAQDGLWRPFDPENVPNAKNLVHGAILKDTGGIVFGIQPYGIVYNPALVDEPKSWLDLFNPRYRGKVGVSDGFFDGYGMTAKALGRDLNDIAHGVRAWAQHKANLGPFPQSPAQAHDLVEKGELWFAWSFGGIAEGAIDQGKKIKFAIPKEGTTAVYDIVHSIKGFDEETTRLTQQFLGLFVSDDAQALWARSVYDSPVSRTVKLPPDLAKRPGVLPPERVARLYRPDFRFISANLATWRNMINETLK